MKVSAIKLLKKMGAYPYLLKTKHSLDRLTERRQEKRNRKKRYHFYRLELAGKSLVFDVGANVGNRCEVFLNLGKQVVAVEPQPSCINILQKKFGNRIHLEPVGLGSSAGELEFYIGTESTLSTFSTDFIEKTGSTIFKKNTYQKAIKVPVVTLQSLVEKHGTPDFCKIDVEGYESEVLKGLQTPIPFFSLEYNVPELTDNLLNYLDILNEISQDYRFNYSEGEHMKYAMTEWMSYSAFRNHVQEKSFQASDFGDIYAKLTSE